MIIDFQIPIFGWFSGFIKFFAWLAMLIYNLSMIRDKEEILSFPSRMVLAARPWKRYNFVKNVCLFLETMALTSLLFFPGVNLTKPFGLVTTNNDNYFIIPMVTPFMFMIPVALLSMAPLKHLDLYTPGYAVALVFLKLACFCQGCCRGIEIDNGMYNYETGLVEFPIQLLESGVALLIAIALIIYRKKTKHVGTVLPMYLILYGITRFFLQYLRVGYPPIFIGLDVYQLFSIGAIILGIIEWILVVKLAPKSKFLMEGVKYKPIEDFCNGIPFPKKEKKVADGNNE